MFFSLLLVTFILAAFVSFCVVMMFNKPISTIFRRIIQDEISSAWNKYVKFAAYVVGISGGVRIHQLERYISAPTKDSRVLKLNNERWILEIYRTIIETLQAIAWMYLVIFIFALIAYIIVKNLFEKSESVLEEGYFGVNALKIRRFWASKDQTMTLLPTFQTGSKAFELRGAKQK